MYLAEAEEIFRYWERHPPPYQMISIIAQMLGWKPRGRGSEVPGGVDLARAGLAAKRDLHDGFGHDVILDFEELKRKHQRKAG